MNTLRDNTGNTALMVVGAVALIALIGGVFMLANNSGSTQPATPTTPQGMDDDAMMDDDDKMMEDGTMMEDDDKMMEGDAMMEGDVDVVALEGGMFYFKPNRIEAEVGEPVTVTLTSVEGMHDFVIDEMNVKTTIAQQGDTVEVTFTPDKAGEYEFYCSVGNHRAQGMVGTIVVEE